MQEIVTFMEKESCKSSLKKFIEKLEIIAIIQVNIKAQHIVLEFKIICCNEIPVVFHNGLNYDYHFIIKRLANEVERKFECLGQKNRKVQNFFRSNRNRSYKN